MLPSRPRLERWNPDSLSTSGQSAREAGAAVGQAVARISNNLKTMPETRSWSGGAHDAAVSMFERAQKQTDNFSKYTAAIGDALKGGAGPIGSARTTLLNKADEIDQSGQLWVNDQWVVLIKGGQMTVEQAAALEKRAQSEQRTVITLLSAVGKADEDTAAKVTTAAQQFGFAVPDSGGLGPLFPGVAKPDDEVPNPMFPLGVLQQAVIRDGDMKQTVRETTVEKKYNPETGEEISTVTTRYMMDGSRYVETVNAKASFSDRSPLTTVVHFDKDNKQISRTETVTWKPWAPSSLAGKTTSTTTYADGTIAELEQLPNGEQFVTIRTPDAREPNVPINLTDHPVLSTVSAAGGKYLGPGVAVATALWDYHVADSDFKKCVAAAEGITGVTAGTLAGLATLEFSPAVSIPVGLLAAGGGEALGNWIGNTFCPR
ncbi:hypothetical protein KZ781_31375 [Mycolicibacterium smegmatis]|nr:hypothetical protein K8P01_14855 [Mycolicibacterium smegmatis]ULN35154.1 hypothetical protein KZ781_31375 [Mycolicibacterium smegmatis]